MNEQDSRNDGWLRVVEGVSCARVTLSQDSVRQISMSGKEMLWVTCMEGQLLGTNSETKSERLLAEGDSALFMWPRGEWETLLRPSANERASCSVFNISFAALHHMLAVDFRDGDNAQSSFSDMDRLTMVVNFSPVRVRDIGRIYIQAHDTRFKSMARLGVFYDVFAEMLEKIYGTDMAACPFQIDAETERRIRKARELVVEDLNNAIDVAELASRVDLPKPVLREGFQFVFGTSIPSYVNEYKFDRAQVMLESGQYLIKEIAFSIGYQNPSHFISSFKQRYGVTPKQWVKQQTGGR